MKLLSIIVQIFFALFLICAFGVVIVNIIKNEFHDDCD